MNFWQISRFSFRLFFDFLERERQNVLLHSPTRARIIVNMIKSKYLFVALSAFSLLGGLGACSTESVTPVAMEFGRKYDAALPLWDYEPTSRTYKVGNVKVIGYSDLTGFVDDRKLSFVLFIGDVTTDCTCFSFFKSTLESYIQSTNAFIYAINPTEFNGDGKKTYDLKISANQGNESIAIFESGILKYQRQRSGENDAWSNDAATFKNWINARVSFSSMLYIDVLQLEKIVVDASSFNGLDQCTIGFFRDRCGDCRYLSDHFLKNYNASIHAESYVIDCDVPGIHDPTDGTTAATAASMAQWNEFKAKYGLAKSEATPFGFDSGYVPTFLHYSNGDVDDADVYDNDALARGEKNSVYKVSESYWDGSRNHEFFSNLAKNEVTNFLTSAPLQAIPESDVTQYVDGTETSYFWDHDKAAIYHDPLIKAFLDYYISK